MAQSRRPQHCFNGATAMKPWKRLEVRIGDVRPSAVRFNGATAMKPWKSVRHVYELRRRQSRFNGATAMKPWKRARPPDRLEQKT